AKLGYLPETVPLYPEMSVTAYLTFIGRLRRVPHLRERIQAVLTSVDLQSRADSLIGNLSKGLRQRVGLAQALLHDPPVLILDEPTIGLDPRQIAEVRDLIKALGRERTVLLSTHILSEVEQICDRALLLINGRVRADFPLKQTLQGENRVRVRCAQLPKNAAKLVRDGLGEMVTAVSATPQTATLDLTLRPETDPTAVVNFILQQGWGLQELTRPHTNLESLFLQKLREAEGEAVG
ncbi:MAG: ATP-binding cassette domain-containing protein, partial [Anaerolineales bacterium]|nr:ATP-binding cassette domain-containing protein [Anaerolineales bacterium]